MTNNDSPSPAPASVVPLAQALIPVRDRYRELVDAAVLWQAARDRRTDPDVFTLVCLGAHVAPEDLRPIRWTRTGVSRVLRCDIPNWCSRNRCLVPDDLPEAMWQWFDFLEETGRLDPESDPLGELRKPLLCTGTLDQRGRPVPHGTPRATECECFLPYRETAVLLGLLVSRSEIDGTDPLQSLRWLVGATGGSRWAQAPPWDDDEPGRPFRDLDDDGPAWEGP